MAGLADQFQMTMEAGGLLAAMRWLNQRVPYRHTAIFAFDGDNLRNVCLVDKYNPAVTRCGDQPITESYCIYVHRSSRPFSVQNASLDSRVEDHPKRNNYNCYYGIPLLSADGKLLGTVCHFDPDPVAVTDDIVTVLDDVAPLIARAAFRNHFLAG
jgi:GAF domain-containing protein